MMDETTAVRAIWESLGLPGIVDVHTHFMPKRVMDKVWQYFDTAGPLVGRTWPITYRTEEADRLEMLRGFGVRAFTSLVYPHKPQMAAWLNQWSAQFASPRPTACPPRRSSPSPAPRPTSPRRSTAAPACSRRTSRSAATTRPIRCSTACGACSRRPGCPSSSTAVRAAAGRAHRAGADPGAAGAAPAAAPRHRPHGHARIRRLPRPLRGASDDVRLDTTMAFTPFVEETMPFPTPTCTGSPTSATASCSAATSRTSRTAISRPCRC